MEKYIKRRVEEITSLNAFATGMESKESIFWKLTELVILCESYLGNRELAEYVKKQREKYGTLY